MARSEVEVARREQRKTVSEQRMAITEQRMAITEQREMQMSLRLLVSSNSQHRIAANRK